jgi:histone arginine demethylase JMJD6
VTVSVDRIRAIDVEEFRREYPCRGRPAVILDAIEHWPARRRWSLDYFERNHGRRSFNFSGQSWLFQDFIAALRAGDTPAPYLNQVKLDEQFTALRADVGSLAYTRNNGLTHPLLPRSMRIGRGIAALFIGGAGSGFGKLHWDFSYLHVYISQVVGSKDFLLYAPEDSRHLYPNPDYPADSLIKDINNFDADEYPDVRRATPVRFTVEEGETAFIPAGWWHATQMREVSMSIAESALDRANWTMRCNWYLDAFRDQGTSPAKLALLRAYMTAMGSFVN